MKVVICPDSYKGTLSSTEVAAAIEKGIHKTDPSIKTLCLPIADGGEGTLEAFVKATNGNYITATVKNPIGKNIQASFGVLGDGETCVIEMAQASGLILLNESERNPQFASTFGTGQLILEALQLGYRKFIICIGGSATNDGGLGMLRALGMKFIGENGEEIENDVFQLKDLQTIDRTNFDARIAQSTFLVACDVNNPLIGPNGATAVFGPQKGVKQTDIKRFDVSLERLANCIEDTLQISLHNRAGAGAAGGLGGALIAFFPSTLRRGIDIVMETVKLRKHLENADYVVTGEGKSDSQTLSGKAPIGIAALAKEYKVPTILISGMIDEESYPILAQSFSYVESVTGGSITVKQSLEKPAFYLEEKVKELFKKIL